MRVSTWPAYYGWFVLAASAAVELLAQGATSYSAGLFVLPLQAEFHISRADANSAILILFLGSALFAPLAGRLIDRFPIRLVMLLGTMAFCGALALISQLSSLPLMALLLLVPGAIGFAVLGPLNTSTMAARWFWRHRGLAMGFAAVATSGGGLVVVPLLARAIQRHGWRTGLLQEAGVIAILVVGLALLAMRDRPADVGLQDHPENSGRAAVPAARPRWREILGRRAFWIPAVALAVISGVCQGVVVTLVPYGVQMGMTAPKAALSISLFALAAAITKVLAGLLADHLPPRLLIIAATVFMMLSQLALWLAPGAAGLLAGASLAGVALGCAMPAASSMIAAGFGSAAFGTVMGWSYALVAALAIIATRFIGFVYDSTKGYGPGFAVFLAAAACAFLLSVLLKPEPAAA